MARRGSRESEHAIEAPLELLINTTLLIVAFTVFALITTINNTLFQSNNFLALQLVLSIPFITASSLARVKLASSPKSNSLDRFAWATFVLGYAFLINSVGLLLAAVVSIPIAITFFLGNILVAISYSGVLALQNGAQWRRRSLKDGLFVLLILLLGLIPSIKPF